MPRQAAGIGRADSCIRLHGDALFPRGPWRIQIDAPREVGADQGRPRGANVCRAAEP